MDAQMCFLKVSVAKIINTFSVTDVSFLFGLNTSGFNVILNTSGKIWHTTKYYSDSSSIFHNLFWTSVSQSDTDMKLRQQQNQVLLNYIFRKKFFKQSFTQIFTCHLGLWSYNCVCRTWVTSTPSTSLLNPTWRGRTGQRRERSSTCSLWRTDRNWYTTLYLYV